jgi:L-lactate utilization protein LutC
MDCINTSQTIVLDMSEATNRSIFEVEQPAPQPLPPNPAFAELASAERLERTIEHLRANGFEVQVADDGRAALALLETLLPAGREVLDVSSQTLLAIGLPSFLSGSADHPGVRPRLQQLAREGRGDDQRRAGASPDVVVGSVHAITERGEVVVASATGSQLAPYVYGAGKVIWVVGTQKIVRDLDEAFQRLKEYTFPLEDARARRVYGRGSVLAKLLLVNREVQPGRISIVLVRENLGF